jgi:hypothetical protein
VRPASRSVCAAVLSALLALSGLVLGAGVAAAAPGPASATSDTLTGSLAAAGLLGVNLDVGPEAAAATTGNQVTDGETAPGVAVGVGLLGLDLLDVGALSASATANANQTGTTLPPGSASATTVVSGIDLLGVVGVGTVTSQCAITPSASSGSTTVAGLTVGGAPLTIAPGATLSLPVGAATVTVSLAETTRTTTGGQLTVTPGVLQLGVTGGVLGLLGVDADLTVAATSCTAPTPASAITAVTPASGPDAGGQAVTITGSGFSGATGVTFGGVPAASSTVVDDATITAITPPNAPGAVDVTVVDPEGNGTLPAGYTYLATPPVAATVAPGSGPDGGGTPVTLTGSGFLGVAGVTFGGVPATGLTVVSDTQLTAVTPAGTAGSTVDVAVLESGQPTGVLPAAFGYLATAPDLTTVVPGSGPDSGGTPVTLTGTGFLGVDGVGFGGVPASSFTVDSDTRITATTPPGAAGTTVDVTVTEGLAADVLPAAFGYVAAPSAPVTATPASGPDAGGTPVALTGTGFTGATGVTFGGVPGTGFTVVSDAEITVVSPPGTPGTVPLAVVEGTAAEVPGGFTYLGTPATATSIDPATGPDSGGTVVTLTGTGFTGATGVTFDGVPGTGLTVLSDTELAVTTPAGTVGPADVVVVDAAGSTAALAFDYAATPADVTGLAPASGPDSGGTVVTLTGTGFTGATAVTFDGVPGTAFAVVSDAQATVTTPAGVTGPADVVVVDAGGDGAADFEYLPTPALPTGLAPATGAETGGTVVTVIGTGLTGATGVTFDGVPGTGVSIAPDGTLTVTTPPGTAGVADVVVLDPAGNGVVPGGFTYLGAPAAPAAVAPATGPDAGGTRVTLTGTGLTGVTGVTFGGVPGTGLTVVSDTELAVTSPAGVAGATVPVEVQDPTGDGLVPGGFGYLATPAVVDVVSPASGPDSGGTPVTLTGSGFTGADSVTVGGTPVPFAVVDDTTLTFTTPPGTVGSAPVVVADAGGDGTAAFSYTGTPVVLIGLAPTSGPDSGGTVVTVTGTGFTGATGVTVGGVPGTAFAVVDDATITVSTPPGTAGAVVDVAVTDPAGTDSLAGAFGYTGSPVTVATVAPGDGPDSGGTTVTLTGAWFTGATGVTVGGVPATSTVVDDTSLVLVTPPGTAGSTADITVTDPSGDATVVGAFDYTGVPAAVTALTPTTGPVTGSTLVTVSGSGFTGVTGVTFGGVPGTAVTVVSDTELRVRTPAGGIGPVDVVVLDPAGGATVPGGFGFLATPPLVEGITPTTGHVDGGGTITLDGDGFTGATDVTVDGVAADFTVVDDDTITVVLPPGSEGAADVVVGGPAGVHAVPGGLSYVAPATVTAIAPAEGPTTGGTTVELTGSGFLGVTRIVVGGVPATDLTVFSSTRLDFVTPPGVIGAAVIEVQDPAGSETAAFRYLGAVDAPVTAGDGTGGTTDTGTTDTGTGATGAGPGTGAGAALGTGGSAGGDLPGGDLARADDAPDGLAWTGTPVATLLTWSSVLLLTGAALAGLGRRRWWAGIAESARGA